MPGYLAVLAKKAYCDTMPTDVGHVSIHHINLKDLMIINTLEGEMLARNGEYCIQKRHKLAMANSNSRLMACKSKLIKTPMDNCRLEPIKLGNRRWTVAYDPDGTFSAENRIGGNEVYYSLLYGSFQPGTILEKLSLNDEVVSRWKVVERVKKSGKTFLDAMCLDSPEERWLVGELAAHKPFRFSKERKNDTDDTY